MTTNQSYKDILQSIPKRILEMLIKLISVKVLILVAASYMVLKGYLSDWTWLVLAIVVIFGREAFKFLKELKG